MARELILTPYEYGILEATNHILNEAPFDRYENIDVSHVLLSALTMAGVDNITSVYEITFSKTKLVKGLTSQSTFDDWKKTYINTDLAFKEYLNNSQDQAKVKATEDIVFKIKQLLFSLKSNSGILTFDNFTNIKDKAQVPYELAVPFDFLLQNVQTKSANLPLLKSEIDKKEIKRFVDVIHSREFSNYKDAQSEIELNQTLTNKTIKAIESAGRDLYSKNRALLNVEENLLRAIPMTTKVVELFFGKLPGILADFSGNIVSDYLKIYKSIPIYDCTHLRGELVRHRLERFKNDNTNKLDVL